MRTWALLLILLSVCANADAQKWSSKKKYSTRQNTMYFYWGYNRSIYTKSDINFQGPGYNFIAEDVMASDRPTRDFGTYVNLTSFTVPQFNIRVGYYYVDHWDISIGYDHMKYVMD